jgi:hypothetical protein
MKRHKSDTKRNEIELAPPNPGQMTQVANYNSKEKESKKPSKSRSQGVITKQDNSNNDQN